MVELVIYLRMRLLNHNAKSKSDANHMSMIKNGTNLNIFYIDHQYTKELVNWYLPPLSLYFAQKETQKRLCVVGLK